METKGIIERAGFWRWQRERLKSIGEAPEREWRWLTKGSFMSLTVMYISTHALITGHYVVMGQKPFSKKKMAEILMTRTSSQRSVLMPLMHSQARLSHRLKQHN